MTVLTWFQIAGAVTFGCLLAAAFVHAIACASRLERGGEAKDGEVKDGEDGDRSYDVPHWVVVALLLPIALVLWALWSLER